MVALETRKGNRFCLHGIAVEVCGTLAERIASDFDFYTGRPLSGKERYHIRLDILESDSVKSTLPPVAAERVFSDCVMYRAENKLFYEYSGGAVLEVERGKKSSIGKLTSLNQALTLELAYLYLQSEIGRFLDEQGLHRVHALGIGLPSGKAALVLLPSGGGKSTLALELLQREGCVLLSDDSPLVDRLGRVYPYLLRLSFRPGAKLPESWQEKTTQFERRKHGPKTLVSPTSLAPRSLPRPEDSYSPGFLVIASRHGSRAEPQLSQKPKWKGAFPLLRDLVVGIGVPQVAELLLTKGILSLPGLAPTGVSRLAAAAAFLARAQTLELELSRDPALNAKFLLEALESAR
ncbi:MAG: hypothetical protein ACXWQO_01515 [Bdellovibrionota bacterium]